MSVSHGCLFGVCLWLDHYLHQHGGSEPMGFTWLGGVATYTTTRDRCTGTVYYSSVTVAGCLSLGASGSGVCFLMIYALSLDAWLSLFYDVNNVPLCIPLSSCGIYFGSI